MTWKKVSEILAVKKVSEKTERFISQNHVQSRKQWLEEEMIALNCYASYLGMLLPSNESLAVDAV